MIKNPLYQIFKISSERFADNDFKIDMTYEQAVINQEVVSLSSSQVLRSLRELCGYSEDNTFIKEYIAISVDKKSQYKLIKRFGVYVNGVKFKRFLCGASNARNETVFFIAESIYDKMFEIMSCGIDMHGKSMILAKWNAYFALNASSSYPVTEPRVVVIPDFGADITNEFEFVDKYKSIEHKEMTVKDYCMWDGMGVMSCQYAEKIGKELQLGYTPSSVVIRASFVKGALFTMDINRFISENVGDNDLITDIYGNQYHGKDIDVIMTKSQFKMSKMYKSWENYLENMHKYNLGWGVTLVSHGIDDAHAFTNYQFLQVLDLDESQIEGICSKTIDWLGHVMGGDIMSTILYMAGTKPFDIGNIDDYALLSLIYNNDMINDSYIRNRIIRSLNKRIRQAYSGKLLMNGNFSFVCCDPYAFLEYAFGKPPNGLLGSNQYYSGFWNRRGVKTVCAMRSPLTWVSENNPLNLVESDILDDWYKYIQNGVIILNRWGVDTFKFADSDKPSLLSGLPVMA